MSEGHVIPASRKGRHIVVNPDPRGVRRAVGSPAGRVSGRPAHPPRRRRALVSSAVNGRNPDQHCRPRRRYPDGAVHAPARGQRERRAAVRQARGAEPRRLGEGPHRRRDDSGGRARRADRARPQHDRRSHLGQHGDRARVRLRGARLRPADLPPAGHEPRARGAAAHVRRDGRGRRVARRDGRGRGRRARAGGRARPLPARSVLEPRQPRGAPHGDRSGDPQGDGRQGRHLRRRRRDRRHDHRRRRGDQGEEPEGPGDRGRAAVERRALRARGRAPTGSRGSARASSRRC